jgi:ribose 5-phosphate isomerase B
MDDIVIASDHAGYQLKSYLIDRISNDKLNFIDYGCEQPISTDYSDYAYKVAESLVEGKVERGILICGTGIGMSMASNRYAAIRAALCCNTNMARLAREHNDANIICLGAKLLAPDEAVSIVHTFLDTDFLEGRHSRRVQKLNLYGKTNTKN